MQDNIYDKTRIFSFNLVPPKSREEIIVLEERDNSILYSFLLVFFSMFIFFILNLIQTFVIDQRIDAAKSQISQQETSFSAYDEIKKIRGELITKGELLEPVLKKDIKLTQLLDLSKQIVTDNPSVAVATYARESSGEFVLTFNIPDYTTAASLVDYLNKNATVAGVFNRAVLRTPNQDYLQAIISFTLKNV